MVHPDARVGQSSEQLKDLPKLAKPNVLLRRDSNTSIGMHREELHDPVNLFLRPGPSPSWVFTFQGTDVLELVK